MSQPMSRSIPRPFGIPARLSQQDVGSPGPLTQTINDYVITPAADDTPPSIHPHAAEYVTQIMNAPVRQSTARPRATAEERAAYIRMRDQQNAQLAAQAADTYEGSPQQSTYAQTAHNVDPSFRVAATAVYDAATGLPGPANTHSRSPFAPPTVAVPPVPAPPQDDTAPLPSTPPSQGVPTEQPAQPAPPLSPALSRPSRLNSAIVLQPPPRTSSLSIRGRAPEMEIEIRGTGEARVLTIRFNRQS